MEWLILSFTTYPEREGDDLDIFDLVDVRFDEEPREEKEEPPSCLENYLPNLLKSYPNLTSLIRQAQVDIPRQICLVNGKQSKTYQDFINALGTSHFLREGVCLSTQSAFSPILNYLVQRYADPEKGVFVTDYHHYENGEGDKGKTCHEVNPIIMDVWFTSPQNMRVELSKKFRVFRLTSTSDIDVICYLTTHITVDMKVLNNQDPRKEIRQSDVTWSTRELGV